MKKNRTMYLKSIILLLIASLSFSLVNAQEEKEEEKIVKIKIIEEDDGNVTIDTTIILDEDFDGDWGALVDDEELLKKLEEMDIDLDIHEGSKVYMIKSPPTTKSGYFYSVDSDDGENVVVEIKTDGEGSENIWVSEVDGDSTITIMMTSADCKHEKHDGEHKVLVTRTMNVEVEEGDDGEVVTYTIKTSAADGEEDIMIWTSDGNEEMSHEILMEKIDGDSCKMIIVTAGDDGKDVKVIKKKEVIIITEEVEEHEHDHDHDKDKDKDKKKKKKKDDD